MRTSISSINWLRFVNFSNLSGLCFWILLCIYILHVSKILQSESHIHDYMDSQPEMNEKMRTILVDWLIEVHHRFDLMPETLYLTINIIDRFLSVKAVPRRELQLVGVSALLIASKYEEIYAPEVCLFSLTPIPVFSTELDCVI